MSRPEKIGHEIIALRKEHPEWSTSQIAKGDVSLDLPYTRYGRF